MLGVLIYIYFLLLGFIYTRFIFKNKDIYFSLWMGGIIGNLIAMCGIVIPSFILDFNVVSHIVLMIIAFIPLPVLLKIYGIKKSKSIIFSFNKSFAINKWILILLILPITIIIIALLTNHILVPTENGVASGQSTYGDLNMHLGFITSIAEQGKFPPDYAFLSGYKLNYPFFIDMLSSSLYLFGAPLRWAVLVPSYVFAILLVMGFYLLAFKISNKKSVAVLATLFFFLCGGLGFSYFLDGAKENPEMFTRIFTGYYKTPTNLNENNIRWANSICDMIIPQRTTMAGWCMFMPCMWLLLEAIKTKKRSIFIILGIIAGAMPMIHTHTFLAFGIICATLFISYFIKEKEKKNYFINWLIFGSITMILALPQLCFWTFSQTSESSYSIMLHFNWVNSMDPYIWFYIKNWGIIALFAIPAFIYTNKDNRKLFISAIAIFIVAEIILFQPNEYDNNKLFFISYMIATILVSDWLIYIWNKLISVKGRIYLAIIVLFLGTFSGILTIGREFYSGGQYRTFSNDMIEMSEYIKENTPANSVFLTSTTHINPVVSLAGRDIYVGSSLYVYFHGLGDEYNKRSSNVNSIYSDTYENLIDFCKSNGITYVYLGAYEASTLSPNYDSINKLEKIKTIGTETLYKIQ